MRWRVASLLRKRLPSCAVCLTNMKGAANDRSVDEHSDELVFTGRNAIAGLGSVAFSVAGDGACGYRGGGDGVVPARVVPLPGRRRRTGVDAAGSAGDLLLLLA